MSSKQYRAARSAAWREANRVKLFRQGHNELYRTWKARLKAWLSPKTKAVYEKMLGTWFKRQIKSFSHQAYATVHDPDWKELQRVRRKLKVR